MSMLTLKVFWGSELVQISKRIVAPNDHALATTLQKDVAQNDHAWATLLQLDVAQDDHAWATILACNNKASNLKSGFCSERSRLG